MSSYITSIPGIMNLAEIICGILVLVLLLVHQGCSYVLNQSAYLFCFGAIMTVASLALFILLASIFSSLDDKLVAVWDIILGVVSLTIGIVLLSTVGTKTCVMNLLGGIAAIAMTVFFVVECIFRFR
ncbi:hypothetical protein GJ496_004764 [Pomphorhynchus laevis]|nr:hypothetical protein GJ496_004764 [Pomphorhynchus laevis]